MRYNTVKWSIIKTKQTLAAILFAVSVRHTVTVARRPSGTFATMIPIRKITASSQL